MRLIEEYLTVISDDSITEIMEDFKKESNYKILDEGFFKKFFLNKKVLKKIDSKLTEFHPKFRILANLQNKYRTTDKIKYAKTNAAIKELERKFDKLNAYRKKIAAGA